jgi:photosystem II stability/assembly factor-like uncharacterized protein
MANHLDGESRLRRYAQLFRREANPPANLAGSLINGLAMPRPAPRRGPVPAFAMAAGVLVAGLVIAFGALQIHNLGRPSPVVTPPVSITSPTPSATPETSATPSATPTATPTPVGAEPGFVPPLAAIQMVGPHLGWAVGSHAIYATTDGTHWTKQFGSTDDFVGLDFISSTTGWVVGTHRLLATSDGGRSWHELGEARQLIRSVHFISATRGWGIAGGNQPLVEHGVLIPGAGATLIMSTDGGRSWVDLQSPGDPQTMCFSDAAHGWLASAAGIIYKSQDGGQTWTQALKMASSQPGSSGWARIECAGPSALWVLWAPGGAAAGHQPYVVYATVNGQTWRTVMAEPGTIGNALPGVPAGPGSYPGSISVVDASDAVVVGDTPPANAATTMIVSNGGATLKTTGAIAGAVQTFDAAFVTTTTGWVLAHNTSGADVIAATTDGGYHWSQQLSVAP